MLCKSKNTVDGGGTTVPVLVNFVLRRRDGSRASITG